METTIWLSSCQTNGTHVLVPVLEKLLASSVARAESTPGRSVTWLPVLDFTGSVNQELAFFRAFYQIYGPFLRTRTMAAISQTPMNIAATQNPPQMCAPSPNFAWEKVSMVAIRAYETRIKTPMTFRFPVARLEKRL